MSIEVVFNQVQAAKQRIFALGDVNTLTGKVAEYESDIAAIILKCHLTVKS